MAQSVRSLRAVLAPRLDFSERRLLLRVGDLFLITASIAGSLWLWFTISGNRFSWDLLQAQLPWAALVFFGWPVWLFFNDLYNLRWAVQVRGVLRAVLLGSVALFVGYLLIFFVTSRAPVLSPLAGLAVERDPLRLAPAMAIGGSAALLLLWRVSYAVILGRPHARRRLLILGAGPSGVTLAQAVSQIHGSHYHIVGFVDDRADRLLPAESPPLLGLLDHLAQVAALQGVDEIAVATDHSLASRIVTTLMDCHERGVAVTPMALLYERITGKVAVEHIGDEWYLALPVQQSGTVTLYRFVKRLMDLAGGAILGLGFLAVYPFVAVAIKLDSPGPVFYVQERVGLHGRPFRVRKFRSMVRDAEGDGQARWAVKGDSRVTRVGALIRKTRLDELPQVLNVISGDMSLVGPRPERQQFIEQLQQQIPFYRARLAAKPGLTGWAQVSYGYGATVEDALIKLQYDLFYIKRQSPWFDLTIMLRTIGVVLRMQGQ
jgi:exopolysaccharide biosynthesis polyprenyl glycosylphosphotransferase